MVNGITHLFVRNPSNKNWCECWWNQREYDLKKTVENVAIRCSSYGKETMLDVDCLDTTYPEIIVTFIVNKMLHHVGML